MRRRVLHIVLNLEAGGLERLVAEIVRHGDRDRFEFHVMALQFLGRFADGLEGFARLHVVRPRSRLSMLWPFSIIREIRRLAPDVVHLHSGVWFKGARAAHGARAPRVVYTDHGRPGPDPWYGVALDRAASRWTDVVVAVSRPLAEQMRSTGAFSDTPVIVIPNGVDTATFRPGSPAGFLHRELGLPPSTPLIGSVGRFEHVKGYDLAIDAYEILARRWRSDPRPALVLVGEGLEMPALRRKAESSSGGSVHFVGWRTDVPRIYREFTVFTLPSRSEGTSVSLLEAMSSGVCPVATRVGGNEDVLGPELTHRLVEPQSPSALASAWREALRDRERRVRDARIAREQVLSRFAIETMVRRYEELYLSGATRSPAAFPPP